PPRVMISNIIRTVIRFRVIVLILVAVGVLVSFYTIRRAPLDAIPDISDPQIVIYAKWPRSPQLLESQVTDPLVTALTGSTESQIKPALQAVPGVAEVASVGGLEKQFQLKIFPPLLANAGIPLKDVVSSVQQVFQEAGGRMIEVTNRDYQLRGAINNDDIDKL